jgi:hypothetical protein
MFSFFETRLFTKLVVDYLSDEEYAALQVALMQGSWPGDSRFWRGPKASMGGARARKARWVPGDLLCAPRQWRDLDANDVPEECRGKHFCARPSADQEGS